MCLLLFLRCICKMSFQRWCQSAEWRGPERRPVPNPLAFVEDLHEVLNLCPFKSTNAVRDQALVQIANDLMAHPWVLWWGLNQGRVQIFCAAEALKDLLQHSIWFIVMLLYNVTLTSNLRFWTRTPKLDSKNKSNKRRNFGIFFKLL